MKIIKNEKLIERNGKIGQWTSLAALIVLGAGMYISFKKPELFIYSVACLVVGFIMTQIGMYMGSRWGRSPRPDEKIDAGLKGLHSEFNLYHYASPISHLLVGPSGVWVLLPYHQGGKIAFAKNRWRLSGGGFMQGYMRIFGQESLGRPEIDAEGETQALRKFLAKNMDEADIPEIKPILIFTNDSVELEVGDSSIAAMKLKQLKEFLRQGAKNRALSTSQIEKITALFQKD
ncbi:MAG: hypothetical protein PHQ36_05595 [Anaerolineales bacterium]|nr:hypothetical protein [Anaerolineales bacterium]